MSKTKSFYWNDIENSEDSDFANFDDYETDTSRVVRDTGLDSYIVNKHYEDNEKD